MIDAALAHARANRERYLDQLLNLLRIPSISTLPEHKGDIQTAAEWLSDSMAQTGLVNVEVLPTGGHPAVYGEWLEAGPEAPTILVYGHYDVQPVDPLELWNTPPFEPTIRDGIIYARGAADDKGQAFAQIKAIESMLAANGSLPLNVKVILEGEEEIGSPSMGAFVETHAEKLAADCVLVSDTAFLDRERPLIINGLRGIVGGEIHVSGPRGDLHSGGYGGPVHNPAQALAEIIAALHDESGRVAIPGFYDRVEIPSDADRRVQNEAGFDLPLWQELTGLQQPWGEAGYSLAERTGMRPTCEVNGIWGGFQGEGGKTIIPARAGAKITMRLVPDQDPTEIGRSFVEFVQSTAPPALTVEATVREGSWPVVVPVDRREIKAASRALADTFGLEPRIMRGGGSIPIVAEFQRLLNLPVVLMGFSWPGNNAHAPNEFHPVDQYHKGIETIIRYYYYLREEAV